METAYLADNLSVGDTEEGNPQSASLYTERLIGRSLLLKVGSLYVDFSELTNGFDFENPSRYQGEESPIMITEAEAWLLKSKVRTGDMGLDNQTNIGVNLTRKIFEVLMSFNGIEIPMITRADEDGDKVFTSDDARELRWNQEFEALEDEERNRTSHAHYGPDKN